jgi:hypothetical protein
LRIAPDIQLRSDAREAGGKLQEGRDYATRAELKLIIDKAPARHRAFFITGNSHRNARERVEGRVLA